MLISVMRTFLPLKQSGDCWELGRGECGEFEFVHK